MTVIQEVLLKLESDYRGHPYYVTGHAIYNALARRVDEETRRSLQASHGVLLPGEWGRWPGWHPRDGSSMGKISTGLRDVETYADLVVPRDAAHRWLNDDRPRDAHNALPMRTHGGRIGIAPTHHFGCSPKQRNHKRSVDWLVHCYLHADGDGAPLPLEEAVLDGLRVGGARNYGFGETSLVDTQLVYLSELSFELVREAEAHRLELLTPYVLESDYPGAEAQSVPWWWAVENATNGAQSVTGARGELRHREERLVDGSDVYALETVDHGQVVGYAGDDPVQTAKNGIRRVGSHSKFGFGEFRIRPADSDRVAERASVGGRS